MKRIIFFFIVVLQLNVLTVCLVAEDIKEQELYHSLFEKHVKDITFNQLADIIKTEQVYKPEFFGIEQYTFEIKYSLLRRIVGRYEYKIESKKDQIRSEFDDLFNRREKISQNDFAVQRRSYVSELVLLQDFFQSAIDTTPVDKSTGFNQFIDAFGLFPPQPRWRGIHLPELDVTSEDIHKRPEESLKKLKQINAIHEESKRKHEVKLRQWHDAHNRYTIQRILRLTQQTTLKESREYIVKLYSVEPRADGELLELFSRSQYPETEKVKILMELNISYKNYRTWESDRRKFRTNAKFVSIDNRNRVTLEKPDGKQTTIDLHRLRAADRTYVREQTKQTTTQPKTESKNN
ncbi:MAG: hypothetical protein LBQ66_16575 [Planctomycetaceae bacterium]|jgi:hypothetical protein|nr:hypothetical protein [Planctomycetaceae bacterium]